MLVCEHIPGGMQRPHPKGPLIPLLRACSQEPPTGVSLWVYGWPALIVLISALAQFCIVFGFASRLQRPCLSITDDRPMFSSR